MGGFLEHLSSCLGFLAWLLQPVAVECRVSVAQVTEPGTHQKDVSSPPTFSGDLPPFHRGNQTITEFSQLPEPANFPADIIPPWLCSF